ncbi:T9SS type A sorting domain-containing protein [Flavobacterium sp. DGU11]|uniref:T9SS type A sorting domain-containing protein n=1 Tax=Flavobacterium arundinis TaxID=3139143 RepID=A0ABU9HT39_9FLAO
MKNTLLFLMLLLCGMAGAQIVNIPDAAFKAKLLGTTTSNYVARDFNDNSIAIDANHDGEIQASEALVVWRLIINDASIVSMQGIEAFTNLRKLQGSPYILASLDVTSLTNLTEINFYDCTQLVSLNVANLANLKVIKMEIAANIGLLDCTGLSSLEELTVKSNQGNNFQLINSSNNLHSLKKIDVVSSVMTSLDCSTFNNLQELTLWSSVLTSLDIENLTNLKKVDLYGYLLPELDLTGLNNLEEMILNCNHLPVLAIGNLSNLRKFTWSGYAITSLDFTGVSDIEELHISGNSLTYLTLGNLTNLRIMEIEAQNLTALDCTGLTALEEFTLNLGFEINSLQMGSLPNLHSLNLDELESLEYLDLSDCTALDRLFISYHYGSSSSDFINLKNGVTEYNQFNISFYPEYESDAQLYICADEGNETVSALANSYIQVSSYCSFTPGGDYNTIAGNLTFDIDNNGCDTDDSFSGFAKMNITNGTETGGLFTGGSGHYNFYTQSGTFTLIPEFENDWFIATPPSATISLATVNNSTTTQNFCIAPNGVHPDVEVVITPLSGAAPGFDTYYKIVYKNKGNQLLSGAVMLNYDDSILDYMIANPVESTSGTGLLTWNFTDLMPFESRSMMVVLNLNGPMEIPAVNLDDVLAFSASITPTSGDETLADNTFTLNQLVIGSFDPNDISCLEGHSVFPEKIGEYLHYNINFENTGTAPATFIVVKDMIDETKFDINTLQLMDASHTIETRINGNKVEFIFDNINLGPEEKGNVTFKIKTLNTLQVNDDVTQQADIFFDYNWPIQTNEATTTFEVLSRGDFARDNSVTIYPNPAKDIVTISADSNVKSIQLYDIQGRLLQSGTVNDINATIDLSSRTPGIYFVKVFTDKGMKVEKVVKK